MLFLKNYLESVENLRKHRLLKIQTYISSSRYIRIKISKRLDNSTESFPQKIKLSGMEMSGQALATLWMVVHSVQGIMFKDLKQISCTKCITIHRVIVCSVFGSSWHSSEFFCQYYSGLFDNSLKYFLHNIFFYYFRHGNDWPSLGHPVDGSALCARYHVQRLEADIAEGTGGCLHPADSQCSCCQKDYCARPTRLEGAIKEFW